MSQKRHGVAETGWGDLIHEHREAREFLVFETSLPPQTVGHAPDFSQYCPLTRDTPLAKKARPGVTLQQPIHWSGDSVEKQAKRNRGSDPDASRLGTSQFIQRRKVERTVRVDEEPKQGEERPTWDSNED